MITTSTTRPTILLNLSFNVFTFEGAELVGASIHYENADPSAPHADSCALIHGYASDRADDLTDDGYAYAIHSAARGIVNALRFAGADVPQPAWLGDNVWDIAQLITKAREAERARAA